jgi:Fe/S biogenesis protein NfuA
MFDTTSGAAGRSSLIGRIEAVLEEHVRPELAELGGGVELVEFDHDAILQVRLLGGCQGCAPTTYQLTLLIESAIKARIPEVRFVEAVP